MLYEGQALPHFNEVDECAGFDALVTNRVWRELGFSPETTLHDVRYGEDCRINGKTEFVWVLEISGAAPPAHFIGGYAGAMSYRQPEMYFPSGGGTLAGRQQARRGGLEPRLRRERGAEGGPRTRPSRRTSRARRATAARAPPRRYGR